MIISISGKIGSGKDTFADMIITKDSRFVKRSFANKLKQIGSILTNTNLDDWFTQEGKNINLPTWGMTIGQFQQKLGTEAIRNGLHTNAWVLALFADYDSTKDFWIVTDMRFENEAKAVKKANGHLIRINGDPAKVRENSTRDLSHPSETSLDQYNGFDEIIDNIETLQHLEARAEMTLYEIFRT